MALRQTVMLATLLGVLCGLAACSAGPQINPNGLVRVAIWAPDQLWPADTDDQSDLQVLSALFAPLIATGQDGERYEVAAASVEPDDAAQVWTITLRDDMKFHNGESVTADSYLLAWNYAADPANQQHSSYLFSRIDGYDDLNPTGIRPPRSENLTGLTRVDEHTFTVTLAEPFRDFPAMLSYPAFAPLPQAAFTSDGDPDPDFGNTPIGNGPFALRDRTTDTETGTETLTLDRYQDYRAPDPAHVGTIELVSYKDLHDAYPELLTGAVDVLVDIPPQHLAAAPDQLGERYLRRLAPDLQFLSFPAHHQQFADPDVRRAISAALDREQLSGQVRSAARTFAAPIVPGGRVDTCGEPCTHDPETARELYLQADGPSQLQITYNRDGGHTEWVETACGQLSQHLGVQCTTSAKPALADVLSRVDAGDEVGVFRLGWAMDYPSLENYLRPLYSTGGSSNWHSYSNDRFDALLAAGAQAASPAEAIAAYQAAEDLLAADLPVLPLSFGQHHVGHSHRVQQVQLTHFGVDLTRIEALQ